MIQPLFVGSTRWEQKACIAPTARIADAKKNERLAPMQEGPTRRLLLQVLIAAAGNFLEWYDFAVYGIFASEISTAFFPANTDATANRQKKYLFVYHGLLRSYYFYRFRTVCVTSKNLLKTCEKRAEIAPETSKTCPKSLQKYYK